MGEYNSTISTIRIYITIIVPLSPSSEEVKRLYFLYLACHWLTSKQLLLEVRKNRNDIQIVITLILPENAIFHNVGIVYGLQFFQKILRYE